MTTRFRHTRLALIPLEDRTTPTAGNMDPTFGGGTGIVTFNLPGYYGVSAAAVAVQPDGKVVMAGTADSPSGNQGAVYRLNADGTLDTTFNHTGYFTSQFAGGTTNLRGIALQPDGKIVVTGSERPAGSFTVVTARLNPDGTLDSTFGTNGVVTTDFTSGDENGYGVAIQPDGKIVVVGDESAGGFMFIRYNPDGTRDTSFDLDGIVVHAPGGYGAWGRGVAIQPDGKIVGIGGGVEVGSPAKSLMLIRLNPDGSYDTTFDTDGIATTRFPGAGDAGGSGVAVMPNGDLMAVGQATVGAFGQVAAARFLPNGALDPAFSQDGCVLMQFGGSQGGGLSGVAVDPNGKAVATGQVVFSNSAIVLRFNDDGSTDPSFGVGNYLLAPGVVYTNTSGSAAAFGLAIGADGRIVTAGKSDGNVAAFRYTGDVAPVPDHYTTDEDTPLNVSAPGVLANDPVTGSTTASLLAGPAHGSATVNADGSFTYTPAPNYNGTDSFTYELTDGAFTSGPGTVSLTVNPVNDPPRANDDSFSLPYQSPLVVPASRGVLQNDTDPDVGDTLHAVLVNPPAQGTLTLNDDGSFTYAFPQGSGGDVTWTYKVNDGTVDGNTATVTMSRSLDNPPVANNDSYELPFASPFVVPAATGVLRNDTDAENDPITATLITPPAVGSLSFSSDGSFTYNFPPDLVGPVTFTYQDSDGTYSGSIATVTLTREGLTNITNGTLTLVGTAGNDVVRMQPAGTGVAVEMQSPFGILNQVFKAPVGSPKITGVDILLGPGDDRLDTTALKIPVTVIGGTGSDVIRTGKGNDTIYGDETDGSGTGNDYIDAGAGNDRIVAGNGQNQIYGGVGNDTIAVGIGGSFVDAGAGNDTVSVAGGSNWVLGGAGNDVVVGGTGADIVDGGTGNDLLVGGLGADQFIGGAGNDILFDGTVTLTNPATDSPASILASYKPTNHKALVSLSSRLVATPDTASADTLTGGPGTDWLWSNDALDVLDLKPGEPHNAVS